MWRLWLLPAWARILLAAIGGVAVIAGGMLLVTNIVAPLSPLALPDPPTSVAVPSPTGSPNGLPSASSSASTATPVPTVTASVTAAQTGTPTGNNEQTVDVPVEQQSLRLPLPPNSKQNDVAPATLDLDKYVFVYATTPLPYRDLEKMLVPAMKAIGWIFTQRQETSSTINYRVTAPDNSTGPFSISPTPPDVPDHQSQVIAQLTRPS